MALYPELTSFIQANRNEDVQRLALREQKNLGDRLPYVLNQIAGWQKAKEKIPTWATINGIIYPPHLSMEQCSSEPTAAYKATLVEGDSFTDLTGGFGVDFSFIARNFKAATMVERRDELCEIAEHNMPEIGLTHAKVINGDGIAYLKEMSPVDVIFIDPARRDLQGRKTVSIADCEPNLLEILDLLHSKAKKILIKYSPMLDISLAVKELGHVESVHIVSVENECKELLFLLSEHNEETTYHCVNLSKKGDIHFTFTLNEERNATQQQAALIGEYLYEPFSSILKAGAYKTISERFKAEKLDTSSHLYTSDEIIQDFPGRKFRVIGTFSMNKRELKEHLQGISHANIAVRNFPLSANELKSKLKLKDGGETYLFATTHRGNRVIVKCMKVE